jgi:hypothetical protein
VEGPNELESGGLAAMGNGGQPRRVPCDLAVWPPLVLAAISGRLFANWSWPPTPTVARVYFCNKFETWYISPCNRPLWLAFSFLKVKAGAKKWTKWTHSIILLYWALLILKFWWIGWFLMEGWWYGMLVALWVLPVYMCIDQIQQFWHIQQFSCAN